MDEYISSDVFSRDVCTHPEYKKIYNQLLDKTIKDPWHDFFADLPEDTRQAIVSIHAWKVEQGKAKWIYWKAVEGLEVLVKLREGLK